MSYMLARRTALFSAVVLIVSMVCGCQSSGGPRYSVGDLSATGFLSDYSKLVPISKTSFRYSNPKNSIGNYGRFMVDPVKVIFDAKATAEVGNWDDIEKLRSYMRKTIIETLEPRYDALDRFPGPGIARVRIALTNIEKSAPLKLGKVTMELEVVDSVSGEQVTALVESQERGVLLYGYDQWSGAKAIMDDWSRRFFDRLEEARGH